MLFITHYSYLKHNKMKYIFSFVLLAVLALTLQAQNTSLYQGVYSPSSSEYEAEYQLIRRHYVANDKGSSINYRKELTILRNRALTAYADKGESFIVWNPAKQELKINECYTIQRDGTRVEMNPMGYVEQLPSNCENCDGYNHLREMAIVHCGMEYGCTIVLDYTITNLESNNLSDCLIIPQDCPVKKYEIIIDAEGVAKDNLKVNAVLDVAGCPKSSYQSVSDNHTYHIVFSNVQQQHNDYYMPNVKEFSPMVVFSTASATSTPIFSFEPIKEAEDLIATCHNDNPLKFVQALRDYVIDYVHFNDIHPSLLGGLYSHPEDTWNSNCGTAIDKAVLLGSLLQQAGFAPTVVPGFVEIEGISIADPSQTHVLVTIDSVEYRLSPVSKTQMLPNGLAQNVVDTITVKESLDYKPLLTPMAGRYNKITLPTGKSFTMNPSFLSSVRTAPLQIKRTEEDYSYTLTLPEGVVMVGKPVNVKQKRAGLGHMEISVAQEGNVVSVHRHLTLEKDVILNAKDYKAFRQWIQQWEQTREIIIK